MTILDFLLLYDFLSTQLLLVKWSNWWIKIYLLQETHVNFKSVRFPFTLTHPISVQCYQIPDEDVRFAMQLENCHCHLLTRFFTFIQWHVSPYTMTLTAKGSCPMPGVLPSGVQSTIGENNVAYKPSTDPQITEWNTNCHWKGTNHIHEGYIWLSKTPDSLTHQCHHHYGWAAGNIDMFLQPTKIRLSMHTYVLSQMFVIYMFNWKILRDCCLTTKFIWNVKLLPRVSSDIFKGRSQDKRMWVVISGVISNLYCNCW